jgi:hypothetical protein
VCWHHSYNVIPRHVHEDTHARVQQRHTPGSHCAQAAIIILDTHGIPANAFHAYLASRLNIKPEMLSRNYERQVFEVRPANDRSVFQLGGG